MWRAYALALLILSLVALPGMADAALADAAEEAAIMHQLRAAAATAVGGRPAPCAAASKLPGWRPEDDIHHCRWARVTCDEGQRVARIDLGTKAGVPARSSAASGPAGGDARQPGSGGGSESGGGGDRAAVDGASASGVLLPGLARLPALAWLVIELCDLSDSRIPAEWGQPGAFPSLTRLTLRSPGFGGSQLPDILPGALPQLGLLDITLMGNASTFRPTLPASWGASRDVLPSLRQLILQLPIAGPLPPQWADGFARLWMLWLSSQVVAGEGAPDLDSCRQLAATASGTAERSLPAAWAAGFPELQHLELNCLRIGGGLPEAWAAGGFPALAAMRLAYNYLNGSLPPHIFSAHPSLTALELEGNRLSGTLPAKYAASRARSLVLEGNALYGRAFPPPWLRPGAFAQLAKLSLGGNSQLTGSLPDQLPWDAIVELHLHDTGLEGTVPATWCRQPMVQSLQSLQIWGTAVSPQLPRCFSERPKLRVFCRRPDVNGSFETTGCSGGTAGAAIAPAAGNVQAAGRSPAGHPAGGLPLLALFVLAAAVVAAVSKAWQQRRRRRLGGGFQLPPPPHEACTGGAPCPGGEAEAAPLFPPNARRQLPLASVQRRARVVRQLQHAMAGRSGGIELMQLPQLHGVLAHNFEGGQQVAPVNINSGSASSSSSSSSFHMLSRQWGLSTDSLRLHPGELELIKGADGLPMVVGEGAHAVVMLGRLQGMEVAVKVFELANGAASHRMWREVALLRDCVHERLVPLYGVALSGNMLLLVQQLMHGGSLQQALQQAGKRDALSWEAGGWRVALDIAEGLAFLHARHTLHADLKSSNVLLSRSLRAYLADLSLSRVLEGTACTARGGTACYAAPEQLLGERCTLAADIYSLGVLLCELVNREPVVRRGGWSLPSPTQCPPAVVELIGACLAADPAHRPSAADVVQALRECEPRSAAVCLEC